MWLQQHEEDYIYAITGHPSDLLPGSLVKHSLQPKAYPGMVISVDVFPRQTNGYTYKVITVLWV